MIAKALSFKFFLNLPISQNKEINIVVALLWIFISLNQIKTIDSKQQLCCKLQEETRALQSTYPAHCICINLRAAGAVLIYIVHTYVFLDDLYLCMLGQL